MIKFSIPKSKSFCVKLYVYENDNIKSSWFLKINNEKK